MYELYYGGKAVLALRQAGNLFRRGGEGEGWPKAGLSGGTRPRRNSIREKVEKLIVCAEAPFWIKFSSRNNFLKYFPGKLEPKKQSA